MRVGLGGLLRGTLFGTAFWISASGVTLSCICLFLIRRVLKFPIYSTSMISAIGHSVGQVITVMFIYKQVGMLTVIPMLLISSIPTGILTGIVAIGTLKRLKVKL